MSHRTTDDPKVCTTVPFGDDELNVVQDGQHDATPLLLIHGLAGSTAWWDSVVPMPAPNFRIVRVDLKGHGKSPSPRQGYDTATQARRVAAALDRLGISRFSIVGHSTGGYVATALAELRRDAVDSIQNMIQRAFASTARGSLEYIRVRSVPDRLAALGVPVQVIFGVEDRRYRSSSATDEYRVIPQTTGRLLSDFMANDSDRNRQAG